MLLRQLAKHRLDDATRHAPGGREVHHRLAAGHQRLVLLESGHLDHLLCSSSSSSGLRSGRGCAWRLRLWFRRLGRLFELVDLVGEHGQVAAALLVYDLAIFVEVKRWHTVYVDHLGGERVGRFVHVHVQEVDVRVVLGEVVVLRLDALARSAPLGRVLDHGQAFASQVGELGRLANMFDGHSFFLLFYRFVIFLRNRNAKQTKKKMKKKYFCAQLISSSEA